MKSWIGVDLDGTLAEYHGWKGELHIGKPIPFMVKRVEGWINSGKDVKIFTARIGRLSDYDAAYVEDAIQTWLLKHIGMTLPVTAEKDYGMVELWDDRAVQVEKNTGRIVGYSTRGLS